jgi:hypothetical protein
VALPSAHPLGCAALALSALALALACPAPGSSSATPAGLGARRGGTPLVRALHASADGAWLAYLDECAPTKAQSLPPDTASCDFMVVPAAGGAEPVRVARAVTTLPGAVVASPSSAEWAVLSEYDYPSASGRLVRWRAGAGARELAGGVSFHGYGSDGQLGYIADGNLFLAPPGGDPAQVPGVSAASSFELTAKGGTERVALARRKGSAGGQLLELRRGGEGYGAPRTVGGPVGDYASGEGLYAFVRLARDGGELQLAGNAARPEVLGQRVRAFAFRPGGDEVAFVEDAAPGKQGTLRVRAGSADLALGKDVGEFRWAAAAPRLAWLEGYDPRVRSGTLGVGGPGQASRTLGKRVSDFELSPDGRWVAYLLHSTRAGYSVDLLLSSVEGQAAPRAVAQGAYGFSFSPDGRWLYYRDACTRNGEGCDLERIEVAQPAGKPEKLAEGAKSFEFDPRNPGRVLVTWKRLDRDALDVAVFSNGKLVTVDTVVLPGSARFLGPDSKRVAYVVVQEKRAGVYVAEVP